jgi:hypothetical protein
VSSFGATTGSRNEKSCGPETRVPPNKVSLEQVASQSYPAADVAVIDARSRASAVSWGFALLAITVVGGLVAYVSLDIAKLDTNALREFLQTTVAGEIGLIAGLLGSRNSA